MTTLIPILLANWQMIGALMSLLVLAFSANTILGAASGSLTNCFDWHIMWNGVRKGIFILGGIFLLTSVFSLAAPIFTLYNITIINATVLEVFDVISVIAPIVTATAVYAKGAVEKVFSLFKLRADGTNIEEVLDEE